jgi:uncharacterized HhH-GPD family protein
MGGLDRMIANFEESGELTGEPEADALLRANGNALLIGTLLDQQIRAEIAFSGPYKLKERLGHLDLKKIANMDAEKFAGVFSEKPAIHRFSNRMAERVQKLARAVVDQYDGDGAQIWKEAADEKDFEKRAKALPGFGPGKVKTLTHALEVFGHR